MTATKEYLLQLGLRDYQAGALTALLDGGELSAKEVSQKSGIPYTKVYDALSDLETRGLIISRLTKPKVYRSLKPEAVIDSLISAQERGLTAIKHQKNNLLNQIEIGYKVEEKQEMKPHVWFYQSTEAIFEAIPEIISGATKTLKYTGSRQSFLIWFSNVKTMDEMYKAARRGVKTHVIFPPDFTIKDFLSLAPQLVSRHWYKIIYLLKSKNTEMRVANREVEFNYMIRDDEEFGTAYPDEEGSVKYGIRFQDPSIAKFMANYYDSLWNKAKPLTENWSEALKKGSKT